MIPDLRFIEAAVWLRPGAVISLQTVLGDAGVWNNYTGWVTAVVPLSSRYTTPSLGTVATGAGTFVFRGVPKRKRGDASTGCVVPTGQCASSAFSADRCR